MADKHIVETIYGKYHKYEIVRGSGFWDSDKFYIHKDGKPDSGSFSSLAAAVDAAKRKG